MKIEITATYPGGQYPIYIGQGLLNEPELFHRHIQSSQVMMVSNDVIAPLYLDSMTKLLSDYHCDHIIIPDGEMNKNLAQWNVILDQLAKHGHHRDTTLINLGGGVIGDMGGFAAACYHRGVAFIQIPTTLLAQVDASIGGKTGVNHPEGKNLIGAFHQPVAVIMDIDTLTTLPEREFRAGIAEMIKAALVKDADFFTWLENNMDAILKRKSNIVIDAIKKACTIKRDIVARDEKENSVRAHLNLGHTFGHAIEHNLGYGQWLHGEAVAVGIVLAAYLSMKQKWINTHDVQRIEALIKKAQLPHRLPSNIEYDKLIATMWGDKKVKDNRLRLILLRSIGQATIASDIPQDHIEQLLKTI